LYWDGELVDADWNKRARSWTLLFALAEAAVGTRQGVDDFSDLGISLKDAKNDLKKLIPSSLFSTIRVVKGVHRLDLKDSNIYLGRFEQIERLERLRFD
jgi:hypothetical protein